MFQTNFSSLISFNAVTTQSSEITFPVISGIGAVVKSTMPLKVSSCAVLSLEKKTPGFVVVFLKASRKPFRWWGYGILIAKVHHPICHLPGRRPKLFIFQDSSTDYPGVGRRLKTPTGILTSWRSVPVDPGPRPGWSAPPAESGGSDARGPAQPADQAPEPRPLTEPALGGSGGRSDRGARRSPAAARAGARRRSWPPHRPIGRRSKRARVVTGIKWVTRPSGSRARALGAADSACPRAQPPARGRPGVAPPPLRVAGPAAPPCPAGNPGSPRTLPAGPAERDFQELRARLAPRSRPQLPPPGLVVAAAPLAPGPTRRPQRPPASLPCGRLRLRLPPSLPPNRDSDRGD